MSIVMAIAWIAPAAQAQRRTLDAGFRTPSGNIHCRYFDFDATLRCDLKRIVNRPLPRPKSCDGEFGRAFEVFAGKNETGPICHGDTVLDDQLPVLDYGARWQRGDFSCQSERTGILCVNSVGAGFKLSRSSQTVLRGKSGGAKSAGGRVD
ncbi:DUF6636 domain-containing protein [Pseudorhodoplanes sp.]|uniref:DUF6636 domain-containing protein n=1 Tax=Pseudorhodoplanes sp. TaxID=1934341 RepID=UPI00391B9022